MRERSTDILIIGGSLGGCAAALAALRLGKRVIMTEETNWIGGQLTSQAVPPDENPWIDEQFAATASYHQLREKIRAYYRRNYPLTPEASQTVHLNPGEGRVSRLCHEPRIALAALEEMFAPYRTDWQVDILLKHRPVEVATDGDTIRAVTLLDAESGAEVTISAPYIIDATELGDLLELGNIEHVIGAESQQDTGELHALPGAADPLDQQAVSWCFAMDYFPEEDYTIDQPEDYDFWLNHHSYFWPGPQLSWVDVSPFTLETRTQTIFGDQSTDPWQRYNRWLYRRILYNGHYPNGRYTSDVTLVNWPQIDYWLGPLVGVSYDEQEKHLRGARQLSLSFLYWMQTAAPREDGGWGYPGLRLRPDIVGTRDGLAKMVYIRESRRIQAEFTILEQHVGKEQRGNLIGAEPFPDSVGIGSYRIDLHPSTGGRTYIDIANWPAQIPLGALLPVRVENLLPACKNLGTTHITNGCYRLHPIEWNIGEAAGALAAHCLEHKLTPRQVRNTETHLRDFQHVLHVILGIPLEWPAYVRRTARDGTERQWVLHDHMGSTAPSR